MLGKDLRDFAILVLIIYTLCCLDPDSYQGWLLGRWVWLLDTAQVRINA